jgi:hypothetical protein
MVFDSKAGRQELLYRRREPAAKAAQDVGRMI